MAAIQSFLRALGSASLPHGSLPGGAALSGEMVLPYVLRDVKSTQ
jgi:hypothetical protein